MDYLNIIKKLIEEASTLKERDFVSLKKFKKHATMIFRNIYGNCGPNKHIAELMNIGFEPFFITKTSEKDAWNKGKTELIQLLEELKVEQEMFGERSAIKRTGHDDSGPGNGEDPYIDKSRLEELKSITENRYDLTRLVQMLEEINVCSQAECHSATIMLVRAVLDHVPPIFGCKNFSEVANNYKAKQRSFKESVEHLNNSSRKIADQHLHCHVRKKEVLPNKTQVNFRNELDILLAEIVRILK